jgi:hypothetical protein
VTVAAVDAVARDVPLVAELNRLLARHVDFGDPWRAIDLIDEVKKTADEEERAEDADPCNRVRAAVKNLRQIPDELPDGSISRAVEAFSHSRD